MSLEDPGAVSFAGIGGLGEQVRELREVIELPLMNPELFEVSLLAHDVMMLHTDQSASGYQAS
jgi:ATP-dependent 26S proteasome regulatory subunit